MPRGLDEEASPLGVVSSTAGTGSTGPGAHYFYGTTLIVSPTDPLTAYVGGAGYSGPAAPSS